MLMDYELIDGKPSFFAFGKASEEAVQQCIDVYKVLRPLDGKTGTGVDKTKKNSKDVFIPPNFTLLLQEELRSMAIEYYTYFQLNEFLPEIHILEHISIQKYPFGGGFHKIHCEKNPVPPNRDRELVFMTYLNDVPAGGETVWPFQNKKVQPKKGLTVIWPAFWTHAHHGLPSSTTEKIIATGWFSTLAY